MGTPHRPKKGSMAYSPRVRAQSHIPRFRSWPETDSDSPKIQGFAGFKAGMTHVLAIDSRAGSPTSGQEIQIPVTVIEAPPVRVVGIRFYDRTTDGLKALTEVWAAPKKLTKHIDRNHPVPKEENKESTKAAWKKVKAADVEQVRLIVSTQPTMVKGIPKKKPDLIEINVAGGTIDAKIEFAKGLLGKDIKVEDYLKPGDVVDVAAVTTGKGFQGPVKRWGIKLLFHKDSKGRRKVGSEGAWNPHWTPYTVPQAGQMGYHHRVEFNKQVLSVGNQGKDVTPKGGFVKYGVISNDYILIAGSIPGPKKRLIGIRDPIRQHEEIPLPEIKYLSTESKQGA